MRRIPRISRWLSVLAGRAGRGWQPAPPAASANRAGALPTGMGATRVFPWCGAAVEIVASSLTQPPGRRQ